MIKLSNGHRFEYVAASGALAFDGRGWFWERPLKWIGLLEPSLFTVVTRTLTLRPRKGNFHWYNPFGSIRFIKDGVVNAVGLTNPGIAWWCRKVGPQIEQNKIPLIVSIFGELDELVEMAGTLNSFPLVGLEINVSCPNIEDDCLNNIEKIVNSCIAVKGVSRFPIILKVSFQSDIEEIVEKVEDIVEAFSINSVPWPLIFPLDPSPLEHLGGGGVSGKVVQHYTWDLVDRLAQMTDIPIIGPSIWNFDDIEMVRNLGAIAVSFGSVFMLHPWRPTLFVKKDQRRR